MFLDDSGKAHDGLLADCSWGLGRDGKINDGITESGQQEIRHDGGDEGQGQRLSSLILGPDVSLNGMNNRAPDFVIGLADEQTCVTKELLDAM